VIEDCSPPLTSFFYFCSSIESSTTLLVTRRNNILSFYRLIYLDWLCMIRQYTKMWCVRVGCGCQRSYLVNLSINWEARGDYDKHDESTINNQWRMNRMAIHQMYLYDIEIAILYSWWTVKWRFWWGMMYVHIWYAHSILWVYSIHNTYICTSGKT